MRHSMRCVSFGIARSNETSALRAPTASSSEGVCDLGLSLNISVFETRFEIDEGGDECDLAYEAAKRSTTTPSTARRRRTSVNPSTRQTQG